MGRALAARLAIPLAVVTLLGSPGCVLLPLGGSPTGRPGGSPSPMGRGLRDYRVILHCHSLLSHDSRGTFERIARSARRVGVDAVILNDHYEPGNFARAPRGPADNGVLLVPGVEIRAMSGSLLAFGMRNDFDKNLPKRELADRFRAEGGLVVAGHVERVRNWGRVKVDGFEIYNLHAEFNATSKWSILWRLLFLPADSFFEHSMRTPRKNLESWDTILASGEKLPPLVGTDAHENIRVFGPLGGVIGTYPELFRLFSNHVLATDLREDLLVDAIRRGRVYSVFDYLGDASGFAMSYGNPEKYLSRDARAILGETFRHDPAATLEVLVPQEAEIKVFRNGKILYDEVGTRLDSPLPGPGVYRAEVYRNGLLWIVSSPIYLDS